MDGYTDALKRAKDQGVGQCDDAAAMAAFCDSTLQTLVGAVSPRLVWDGAQASGLTLTDLATMAATDAPSVHELMWVSA